MAVFNNYVMLNNIYDESLFLTENALNKAKSSLATGRLKVAVIGDSVSEGADIAFKESNFAGMLERALKDKFGSKIIFKNYAIGGSELTNFLDNRFIADRIWNSNKIAWNEVVRNFNPDLLIVAFGVNSLSQSAMMNYESQLDKLTGMFEGKSIILVNNLELGDEPPTRDNNVHLNCIAKTQYYYAKKKGLGCINAHRIYRLLTYGVDDYSHLAFQQPMWAGGNMSEWKSEQGLTRTFNNTGNKINVNYNSPTAAMIRYLKSTQNTSFEGTLEFGKVDLSKNPSMIFVARESAAHPHVIGIIIKVTINSRREIKVTIGTGAEEGVSKTFDKMNKTTNSVYLKIGVVDDKIYIDCKYLNQSGLLVQERIIETSMPKAVYTGGTYFQFENMAGLKIDSPAFFHTEYKKASAPVMSIADIYGPTGEANGGNGRNHPCDHAFQFIFSRAVKDLISSL